MALLSEFACTQIKTQVLPFLKKKKIQSVSVHMKKRFRTENMACKEERGKCVILNGETSCLDQIETRWERKNQRSKAETHSGKRHQRQNVLTSQRNGTSQTSLPVVLDHMACRDRPSAETWEANRSRHPESAKELIQKQSAHTPRGWVPPLGRCRTWRALRGDREKTRKYLCVPVRPQCWGVRESQAF